MSKINAFRIGITFAILLFAGGPAAAQNHETHQRPDHVMINLEDQAWSPAPASLPPGARAMVIEGNPGVAGEFTLRLWFPADYAIQPHFHPADEHVTVISGSFYMGIGETFDERSAKRLTAGGFAMMKTGTTHYAFTKEETVVQLHGVGPWGLTYVDAKDDPRTEK
jgi:hypothetical protein